MSGLTNQEIKKIVNRYIGVFDGYLSNFSYRTHADFYPEYCDLDVDPNQYEGTTRQRFITILENSPPHIQAKIVRGVLQRFPLDDESKKPSSRTKELYDELLSVVLRLEGTSLSIPQNEQITNKEKEIFISYAWGGESEEFVNKLDAVFQTKGITITRDKEDLGFKGRIKPFMERIGRGKAIIVIVSEKYLKSENCMYELVQISKNGQFYDRIFPIVLNDTNIYKSAQRIKYIQYWEEQIEELDKAMKTVNSANLQGFREDIDLYTEIRATIADLTNILRDMNTLSPSIHTESNFEVLFNAIKSKVTDLPTDSNTCRLTVQKPASSSADVTLQQFIDNQLNSNEQLAFFIKQIGLANPRQDYTKAQFEAYCNIWKSLQALRLVGSELWDKASKDNLVKFANQLRDTTQLVYENSIFFEEADYSQLKSLLEKFKYFQIGKDKLIRIRSTEDIERQEKLFIPLGSINDS
ncbi:MAG: toll/interleukin-1 receptor domain-containing protein [Leptolyngbyaceae cyanobacterium SL_5_14]|nr:toll/interleukin-1 receptor domain-containing protein [Leptolyngbyaceae cyanobacterium SL_5_14]